MELAFTIPIISSSLVDNKEKGTDVVGYNFIINVEKSRYVREKSKIPIEVSWEGGISKWSGLLDMKIPGRHVVKPSNGWYAKSGDDDAKKYRTKDTYSKEFWLCDSPRSILCRLDNSKVSYFL